MKQNFDKNTKERSFKSGDKVLALLPIPGRPLQARYFGPYTVEKKASDLNYTITTPDRCKQKQLCHINMLKEFAPLGILYLLLKEFASLRILCSFVFT